MKKITTTLLCCLLIFTQHYAFANISSINGTVTDQKTGEPLIGVNIQVKENNIGTVSNFDGKYSLSLQAGSYTLVFGYLGYKSQELVVSLKANEVLTKDVALESKETNLEMVIVETAPKSTATPTQYKRSALKRNGISESAISYGSTPSFAYPYANYSDETLSRESYNYIAENGFKNTLDDPLSTFSIDVDKAAYSNVRRYLNSGSLPPKDAVRIEEMINYFNYDYEAPKAEHPFSITTEMGACPWNNDNQLVHIGLKGETIDISNAPNNNLVFLLDVSGSMNSPDKLLLLKKAFTMLTKELRSNDRVAIVTYAGAAGVVLPSTAGNQKTAIVQALDLLEAGGSTAGGEGIQLAYKIAQDNFIPDGNNRVILATDGDFNVGVSSEGELVRLIEDKRQSGVFLTTLGFGRGNLQDSKMEQLADKGNGNYAYIDSELEARKVLVTELGGTLLTIAKDVKIQVEFNPARVQSYRLVGYENRLLNNEDFNDDTKDAGELGAGHTVTALYEIVLNKKGQEQSNDKKVDELKYQSSDIKPSALNSNELMTVKFRYKAPKSDTSILIEQVIRQEAQQSPSDNFNFSAAVAGFGMLLRQSEYLDNFTYAEVLKLATKAKSKDNFGYRAEFIKLVNLAKDLDKRNE